MSLDLAKLNPPQREAVLHGNGPLLILAGAGSGKTRVITYRIAHLVLERHIEPWRILAVTFTNKAAGEMRERLTVMLGDRTRELNVSTFHATGAWLLRREAEALGLTRSFVIYDDTDQMALIKRAMRAAKIDERAVPAKAIRARFDESKNEGKPPDQLWARPDDEVHLAAKAVYPVFEDMLLKANSVDFGDLIVKPLELFRTRPDILARYRGRFQHVMVDEFQDTNPSQFGVIQRLCPPGSNLAVVGDDDQAIYRWRGADVDNILSFDTKYPGCRVVKLEQNYRSDANILDAAYAVIRLNTRRREKRLVTDAEPGYPLVLLAARDERGEALQVATSIRQLLAEGNDPNQVAVFYRTNAQSRVLEEALRVGRVPYAIVRGRSFYDRAEVKDAVSYLRLALNPQSDADLLRVINTPPRGIGETTVDKLTEHARQVGKSAFEAIASVDFAPGLNSGARQRLQTFREIVEAMRAEVVGASAADAITAVVERSGLVHAFEQEGTDEAQARIENVQELVSAASEFDREYVPQVDAGPDDGGTPSAPIDPLAAFLEQISLIGEADVAAGGAKVSMMTLHAAKGLEFDCVFLTGMEENVFPHSRATAEGADPEEIAEERRLCYVGITRARKRLFLSLAQSRSTYSDVRFNRPSRFISEIPRELFGFGSAPVSREEPVFEEPPRPPRREAPSGERVVYDAEFEPPPFDSRGESRVPRRQGPRADQLGDRVIHEKFGEGLVTHRDGSGDDATVSVRFASVGPKKIKARYLRPV